ncbi:MAG TPA: calcium-binding protein, partial [Pelolinea sp.]|nr:calcium-binding protein [Pelolinea sp.]
SDTDEFFIPVTNPHILKMLGGAGDDFFYLIGSALVPGKIDGQDGVDSLDYSAYDIMVTVDLAVGAATAIYGELNGGVARIERLVGSLFDDFLYGDNLDNIFVGNDGIDLLVGRGGNDTYVFFDNWGTDTITETSGGGTDALDFSGVTGDLNILLDLNGWEAQDSALNLVSIAGLEMESFIGSAGFTRMDVSAADSGGWDLRIKDFGALHGFAGTLKNLARKGSQGIFDNLDEFVASIKSNDVITGLDIGVHPTAEFIFATTQYEYASKGINFLFANFETINGGSADDTFFLFGDLVIDAFIDGQDGIDTVDYSAFTTSEILVNLPGSFATALNGGFAHFEAFIGTPLDDKFIGDRMDNIFEGGAGDDTYVFDKVWGNDTITDAAGAQDTLDFTKLAADLTVSIYTARATISDGVNVLELTLNTLEQVLTGAGDDRFIFVDDGALLSGGNGIMDAAGGIDLLDYQGYGAGSPADVNLSSNTATGTNGVYGIENVYGGLGNDSLTGDDSNDNVLRGREGNDTLDGGDGVDTLDESQATVDLVIDLWLTGAQATRLGTDTITNIENLITSSGNDRLGSSDAVNLLNGGNGNDTYFFRDNFGEDRIEDSGGTDTIEFTLALNDLIFDISTYPSVSQGAGNQLRYSRNAIEALVGGQGNDRFEVDGDRTVNISGHTGNDTLMLANGAELVGLFDGHAGEDSIDFSKYRTNRKVYLTGAGLVDGFAGYEAAVQGFTNVNLLIGGTRIDSLVGLDQSAVWEINTSNYYYSAGSSIGFEDFERLLGGDQDDRFEIFGTTSFNGNIQGGDGVDELNYLNYLSPVLTDLQVMTSSGLTGVFSGIEKLVGSLLTDTLKGKNANAVFELDGSDRYISESTDIAFSGYDILRGGSKRDTFQIMAPIFYELQGKDGNDEFIFADGALLSGSVDGGDDANMLDYSQVTSQVFVQLTALGNRTGFDGLNSMLSGGFSNISTIIGGSGLVDTIEGMDQPSKWIITENLVDIYESGGRQLNFSLFENLQGGLGNDAFVFRNKGNFVGSLDGGGGTNQLNYRAFTTGVTVDLQKQLATGVSGTINNFSTVLGGKGPDVLLGDDFENTLDGGDGNDLFDGRGGNDTLVGGRGDNLLIGGDGYDTGIITYGSTFWIPLNDVENLILLLPPTEEESWFGDSDLFVIVTIQLQSQEVSGLTCENCDYIRFELLPDLHSVLVRKDAALEITLERIPAAGSTLDPQNGLPGPLPFDLAFVSGMQISLEKNGQLINYSMTMTFNPPFRLGSFEPVILFWDETANGGAGGWVEIPAQQLPDGSVTASASQSGWYVLAARGVQFSPQCADGETAVMSVDRAVFSVPCVPDAAGIILPVSPDSLLQPFPEGGVYLAAFQAGWIDGQSVELFRGGEFRFDLPDEIRANEVRIYLITGAGYQELPFSSENGGIIAEFDGEGFILIEKLIL